MSTSHRTPAVFLLLPVLLAGGACAGSASAQQTTFEFTNSGQTLGDSASFSVALGDLDGDGALDAMVANYGQPGTNDQPNTVWMNGLSAVGVRAAILQMSSQITQLQSENTQMQSDITQLQNIVAVCCAQGNCPADLNGDGEVNGEDLAMVLGAWGLPCDS